MTDEKQTTTIELTQDDRQFIQALSQRTGITTTIGVLRFALREAVTRDSVTTRIHYALTRPGASATETAQDDTGL